MICTRFIYVDLGRTGSNVVRNMLCHRLTLDWIDATPHVPLGHARNVQPTRLPSFTFVRNPFDWYISYYLRDMEMHYWRGTFRDWLFDRRIQLRWMSDHWSWMGCSDVDHVGRFETLLDDMIRIFGAIMPDLVTAEQIREWFPECAAWSYGSTCIEGVEQWMRDELYGADMVELVYEKDADLFGQFDYTFEERYYHPGGCGASRHEGVTVGDWEGERGVTENWAAWQIPRRADGQAARLGMKTPSGCAPMRICGPS
jgi:hypothetical protein